MLIKMNNVKMFFAVLFILSSVCCLPQGDRSLNDQILDLYGPHKGEQMKHHTGIPHPPPNILHHHDATGTHPIKIDPAVLEMVFGSYPRTMPVETPSQLVDNKTNRHEKPKAMNNSENVRDGIIFRETKPDLERTSDGAVPFSLDDRLLSRTLLEGQFHGNLKENETTSPVSQPTTSKINEPHDAQNESVNSNHITDEDSKLDAKNKNEEADTYKTDPFNPRIKPNLYEVNNEHNEIDSGARGSVQNPTIRLLHVLIPPTSDNRKPEEPPTKTEDKFNSKSLPNHASSRNFASIFLYITILIYIIHLG